MCRKCFLFAVFLVLFLGLGLTSRVHAALIINLDFSDFSTGAPADRSAILGGATLLDAQTLIRTAADYWEKAFANSRSSIGWSSDGTLTHGIKVQWSSLGGNTLATGGTSWYLNDGRWVKDSGVLTFDNDGSSRFFVDSTPTDSEEWRQFSERAIDFAGVTMNAERVHYDADAGPARDNIDMLSVAKHEIAHALGFLNGFPAYADNVADDAFNVTTGSFAGAEIPVHGSHTEFTLLSPAGGDFPYDPGSGSFFNPFDYYPNLMGPSIVPGTRLSLTEVDIAMVAEFLEFDMSTVNFNPSLSASAVPEPSSMLFLGLAVGWGVRRKIRSDRSIRSDIR